MKRVTHQAKCSCLSHLTKILKSLPPDIVCNCVVEKEVDRPECEIKTVCLAPSAAECNCAKEDEVEFVSACDVLEPLVPKEISTTSSLQKKSANFSACFERPKIPNCICGFECPLTQDVPEKEFDFTTCRCSYDDLHKTCVCEYGCPLRQEVPTKESGETFNSSTCNCSLENSFTMKPTKEFGESPDVFACKCSFEDIIPVEPTDFNNSKCPFNFENMSLTSANSQDLVYVDKIKTLIEKEKYLKKDIQELEHKERTYTDKLKELKDINTNTNVAKIKESIHNLHVQNQLLEDDNKNLEDQIKDVKLELKQVMENVEGPLKRELERERRKGEQLEIQIKDLVTNESNLESKGRKEIEFLSRQLENAKRNVTDLHLVNERLREELCVLCCKCNEMENELINQKLREVNLLNVLSAKKRMSLSSCIRNNGTGGSIPKVELEAVAKNLSQLLREARNCSTCHTTYPGIIDTVKCIKDLVNVVNSKKKDSKKDCIYMDDK